MSAKTCLARFEAYGLARSDIYMVLESDRQSNRDIFELFDEMSDLLVQDAILQHLLPREFLLSMQNYNRKVPETVAHFDRIEHRAFYLSDLYDYLTLGLRVGKII